MKKGETITSTERYQRKKDDIVAAATAILNRDGARGMTLADVAGSVGLITTSVTYYFKKKEDLAVACFLRAIERFDTLLDEAGTAPTPEARVRKLVAAYFALARRIAEGEEAPIATFSDVRSLGEPHLSAVMGPYAGMFRKARALLEGPETGWMRRAEATARTHILLEQMYWTVIWLPQFEFEDYPRLTERLCDVLLGGLMREGGTYAPRLLGEIDPPPAEGPEQQRATFLMSATRLINQRGYRGASVEQISRQLNVTKGSFYHHNEAKDDLVMACFERYFTILRRAQSLAMAAPGSQWEKLCAALTTLADYQLSPRGPLLRVSALSALPEVLRHQMMLRAGRVSTRFAGMIADGIAEGSIRPVDPFIASMVLNATLNGSSSVADMLPKARREDVADLYMRPVLTGLFSH